MKKKIEKAIKELKWFWHFQIAKYFSIKYYIPNFVRNVWYFRKELNEYRTWDFHYSLLMFHRSIQLLKEAITNGHEVEDTRMAKVAAMEEVLYLLKQMLDEVYHDKAKASFNLEPEERIPPHLFLKVIDRYLELEEQDWDRMVEIFKDREKGIKTWWE